MGSPGDSFVRGLSGKSGTSGWTCVQALRGLVIKFLLSSREERENEENLQLSSSQSGRQVLARVLEKPPVQPECRAQARDGRDWARQWW